MFIPRDGKIGRWAAELIQECQADLSERIERGAMYRNLYLTGDENGNPVTFNRTYPHIDGLASALFSPIELNFKVESDGDGHTLTQREVNRVASRRLRKRLAKTYAACSGATEWSLVKGKAFVKLIWEGSNPTAYMVQPEFIGVLLPDKNSLDDQPAFTHSSYYTPQAFAHAFGRLDNIAEVMKQIGKRAARGKDDRAPDRANALKQIILGGLNPFQAAGGSPATASSRGIVNWLGGPAPTFDAKVLAQLIRLDELWVKDSRTGDLATFQMVGDVMVIGDKQIRNAFSDAYDPDNPLRTLPAAFTADNPLTGMHPFVEFCVNPLEGYFWGRSEVCNVGVLQMQINARIDGINRLLRQQEDPSKIFTGMSSISRDKYSAARAPGGYYVDPSPTAKMQSLYPELPQGLWESLHEMERMYEVMAASPPVLRGKGEAGVRAQSHADTLTRNASPPFKDRALRVEDSIAELGSKALALLQAHDPKPMIAWLAPDTTNLVANLPSDDPTMEPPAPGMKPYPFRWADLAEDVSVSVDSHSSSPVFGHEGRQLLFDLSKMGAISPKELVEQTNPPGEDDIIADLDRKDIKQAQLIKEHPELLEHQGGKKKR